MATPVAENETQPRADDLGIFVTALEAGSLTAAAARLGLPKSTVSRRLSRLEDVLGARLLVRSPSGLVPTDAGRVALEPARAVIDDISALRDLIRGSRVTPRGRLRVSAAEDLAGMPWWIDFAARFPEVRLEIEFSNRYVDLVREGFDVALRGGRGDDETLIARRVGTYRLRAVAAPAWVAEHGTFQPEDALFSRGAVVLSRPGRRADHAARVIVVNDNVTALRGALRGLGVAVLAEHVCGEHLDRGELQTVHPTYDPLEVPVFAVFPDRRYIPAALSAFLDCATEALR